MTDLDGITGGGGATTWWGPEVEGKIRERLEVLVAEVLQGPRDDARALIESSSRRYLLVRQLGTSVHARVYLAVDRVLARRVVVKIHEGKRGPDEAEMMTIARHRHVVEIHDFGEHDGHDYAVLEYCEGTTLARWCAGKSWREIVDRIIEAGRGLEHCHFHQVIHGDIKPENILVTQGRAVLADFGLAGRPDIVSEAGGTLGYIAPELARTGQRGPMLDLYALAVTAWRCLFGELPFPGKTVAEVLVRACESGPDKPKHIPPGLPVEVMKVIAAALIPDPDQRPRLGEWLEQLRDAAELPERAKVFYQRVRRGLMVAVAVASLGLLSYSGQGICAAKDPPTIADAIEAAQAGSPFAAYADWYELTSANRKVTAEEALLLADAMLTATKQLPKKDQGEAALLTKRVATRAGILATDDVPKHAEIERRANAVLDAANEIIRSSPPSHPR